MDSLLKNLLLTTSLIALPLSASNAQSVAPTPLKARAEVNGRIGTDRSIGMTEFWIPLAQDDDSVFYGDLRLVGDNQDNREGNLGLGYRKVITDLNGVVGAHAWFDRRKTERGSKFNQITVGAEYLGETFDVLVNGYIPLSDEREIEVLNTNPQAPALVGNQIVVDTNGRVLEEPQGGLDLELGYNVPFFKEYTDSLRVYAGGFYFDGDNTESVAGWRARVAADITPDIQIGARFQRDDERGSQGFLEATVRFPFGQKKSFREEGLRARLDDSPERDIDIVTNDVVTDTGSRKAVINNDTGTLQKVIHVDNMSGGGDGTAENPFNTLTAAQAAAAENDIIYVNTGDGGVTGQDQGVTLSAKGLQLIGAGSDFIYDNGKFSVQGGGTPSSTLLRAAGTAPLITNLNANGDGITINADDVSVVGVTVNNAQRDGIVIAADGAGNSAQNVTIDNVTATNNRMGVYIHGSNDGAVSAKVQNTVATTNRQHGLAVYDDTNATFEADLGGGDMGSVGNNVLAGNTLEDLAIEYDGRELAAMHNWWGASEWC